MRYRGAHQVRRDVRTITLTVFLAFGLLIFGTRFACANVPASGFVALSVARNAKKDSGHWSLWEFEMFTRVCKEDTITEGGMRVVIADAQVIILAWPENGVIKAFQGVCPHTNAPLAEAEFDGTVLTCPSHAWTWDMNTGEPIHPKESALAEYPVKIEEGVVYIDTEGVSPLFAAP